MILNNNKNGFGMINILCKYIVIIDHTKYLLQKVCIVNVIDEQFNLHLVIHMGYVVRSKAYRQQKGANLEMC